MSTLFPTRIPYTAHTKNGTSGYTDEAGDWVPGVPEELFFLGSVQPATGQDYTALPTGREGTGMVKVYSDRELPYSSQGGDDAGAVISWDGLSYEVIGPGTYKNGLIPHFKYMAVQKGAQA